MSSLRVLEGSLHELPLQTRLPFQYGIATMTHMPMAFVRLQVQTPQGVATGTSADLLPPKWFTKDPQRPVEEEIVEMRRVILHALAAAKEIRAPSAFIFWQNLYVHQADWGKAEKLPSLMVHFGTSLVERALIEAVCRASGRPFAAAARDGTLGIDLGAVHASLTGSAPADWLPEAPLPSVTVRHTVGLADPLTEAEITPANQLRDGLPQALTECIHTYGLRHFKLKLSGDRLRDLQRLGRIVQILNAECRGEFAASLDGNEQFKTVEAFRDFWQELRTVKELEPLLTRLLFVEQPLHRSVALQADVARAFRDWPERPPVIIDESDAELTSLPRALELGYAGTSHKNCKGVFKGLANRCLIEQRRREQSGRDWLMSGEDLCNVGPVALLQDLAVMAALGIESVERNGHHYNAGLSRFPRSMQEDMLRHHPDLYHRSPAGWPTLSLQEGHLSLASINAAPFGVGCPVDLSEVPVVATV